MGWSHRSYTDYWAANGTVSPLGLGLGSGQGWRRAERLPLGKQDVAAGSRHALSLCLSPHGASKFSPTRCPSMAPSFPAHVQHPAGTQLPPVAGQGLCCRGPGAAVFLLSTGGVTGPGGSCRAQHWHLSTPQLLGLPASYQPVWVGVRAPKAFPHLQCFPSLPASRAGDPLLTAYVGSAAATCSSTGQ